MGVEKEPCKFFVFKRIDIEAITKNDTDIEEAWATIMDALRAHRVKEGKPAENDYIVCNQDEPYAQTVWNTILRGENAKFAEEGQPCPHCGEDSIMFAKVENCTCHISPPCSACTDAALHCPTCGWEPKQWLDHK